MSARFVVAAFVFCALIGGVMLGILPGRGGQGVAPIPPIPVDSPRTTGEAVVRGSRTTPMPEPLVSHPAAPADAAPVERAEVRDIAQGIVDLRHPETRISTSHLHHPGFEDLAYLYDTAVNALILHAAGRQAEAESILDYFDARLRIPLERLRARADTSGVYGILKRFTPVEPRPGDPPEVKALINALDRTSVRSQGRGRHEFVTTPGPTAFLLYAMAHVHAEKYAESINGLRGVLRAMQAMDGGFRDGDRSPVVHTEPHVNAAVALLLASGVSAELTPWPERAEAAWRWFTSRVFDAGGGVIHQGVGPDGLRTIFATDVYTWTMAGPFGDRIAREFGRETLRRLSRTLLHRGLVEITWTPPDGTTRTRLLFDFTDPTGPEVNRPVVDVHRHPDYGLSRGARRPIGSTEWTAGAVLAFQMNAVRFWEAGDRETAVWFKALADALTAEVLGSFYTVDGVTISEYATGHNVATGHGWRTPVAYARTADGTVLVRGGSTIGGWVVLPVTGLNPFIARDGYLEVYDRIPSTPADAARELLRKECLHEPFIQPPLTEIPFSAPMIVEPEEYNRRMFEAFERGDYRQVLMWAERTVLGEPDWLRLAKAQQRRKAEEVGGIVTYPWGRTFPNNEHVLHDAIFRYPLLNEVGAAMWGLAVANYELGERERAKAWIRRIIEEVPLHQIASVTKDPRTGKRTLVNGYWNALIAWELNPGELKRDERMQPIYREVLGELGRTTATPKVGRRGY